MSYKRRHVAIVPVVKPGACGLKATYAVKELRGCNFVGTLFTAPTEAAARKLARTEDLRLRKEENTKFRFHNYS